MCQFARYYPSLAIGQQAAVQLPWGQITMFIQKVKDSSARDWSAEQSLVTPQIRTKYSV